MTSAFSALRELVQAVERVRMLAVHGAQKFDVQSAPMVDMCKALNALPTGAPTDEEVEALAKWMWHQGTLTNAYAHWRHPDAGTIVWDHWTDAARAVLLLVRGVPVKASGGGA